MPTGGRGPRILVAEFMDPQGLTALDAGSPVDYRPELGGNRAALLQAVAGVQALVVRNRCRVDGELLSAAGPQLRVVGRLGAGLDNIDLPACARAAVRVVFARGANAQAVCEYVFAATLHLLRPVAAADRAVRSGQWPREAFTGGELSGRTLGVLGLGEVGRRLCAPAAAFGMRVIGTDPAFTPDSPVLRGLPVRLLPLPEVLATADVISLHLPLLPATHHLVDGPQLARMREGSILIQAARGGVVDEAALADHLRSGHLAGAALDVREVEPPPQPDPLAGLENVLLTPHLAGLTHEAQRQVGQMVADDVLRVLRGDAPLVEARAPDA